MLLHEESICRARAHGRARLQRGQRLRRYAREVYEAVGRDNSSARSRNAFAFPADLCSARARESLELRHTWLLYRSNGGVEETFDFQFQVASFALV